MSFTERKYEVRLTTREYAQPSQDEILHELTELLRTKAKDVGTVRASIRFVSDVSVSRVRPSKAS